MMAQETRPLARETENTETTIVINGGSMKIGFIGAGNIAGTAARLFVEAGHEVAISNSRGPQTLSGLVSQLGPKARAVSVEDAIQFGDVVFISIPFGKYKQLPTTGFDGKVVIDSNNYYPERDGRFGELDQDKTTSSELLAKHLGKARVVKAFNTIWVEHLKAQGNKQLPVEERRVIFLCGDDPAAKKTVAHLIEEIGFAPVDTGSLHDGGKKQQPNTPIYNKTLTANEAKDALSKL
jgi:predicted dinucleotide-binding enzyme